MVLKLIKSLTDHTEKVWSVCWNPTGDKFATCGGDKIANIHRFAATAEKESGFQSKLIYAITEAHKKTIREASFSPCGKFLALASFDGTASIWEENSKKNSYDCITTVEGHDNEVKSIAWSPSGQFFATCGRDKGVMIWSLIAEDEYDVECESTFTVHTQDVKRVLWNPHEDILVSASYDDTIKMFRQDPDDHDWSVVTTLEGHTSTVWGIDFDKTGKRLVSCSDDRTVKVWSKGQGVAADDWICTNTIAGFHDRPIYDVSWSSQNDLIATACGDNLIRIFKENITMGDDGRNTFDCVCSVEGHEGDVNNVKWNPTIPDILASGSDDGTVKLWKWIEE